MTGSVAGPGKAAASSADPMDELFPRVEVDSLLKGTTVLTDAKSDAWKAKKEGLETFQAILDQGANKRLKSSMGWLFLFLFLYNPTNRTQVKLARS
jgi:cytoskeleton-associated protein 5